MVAEFPMVAYPVIGFAASYLALETAWHFTACRFANSGLKPCLFKQVKLATVGVSKQSGKQV